MLSSRGSSQPGDQTQVSYVSCIGWQVLYCWHHILGGTQNTPVYLPHMLFLLNQHLWPPPFIGSSFLTLQLTPLWSYVRSCQPLLSSSKTFNDAQLLPKIKFKPLLTRSCASYFCSCSLSIYYVLGSEDTKINKMLLFFPFEVLVLYGCGRNNKLIKNVSHQWVKNLLDLCKIKIISDPEEENPRNRSKIFFRRYNSTEFPWNREKTKFSSQGSTWKFWVPGNSDGDWRTWRHPVVKFLDFKGKEIFLQAPRNHIKALTVEKSSQWGMFAAKTWLGSIHRVLRTGKGDLSKLHQSGCQVSIKARGSYFQTQNISWNIASIVVLFCF